MARRRKGTPPSYCLHKQSGQAAFNWPLGGGKYRTVLLGKYGQRWQVQAARPGARRRVVPAADGRRSALS